ncbi:Transcription activator AMTR1 [Pseudocercospora fuligena]|uniref:Transcription activator AMTR1 n=1 Tax=Pseudocercospora fuligena TaxID=685502 RepID=A0A8H6VNR9_9PEZI|nr:Transcription activator AMTR1 [Pseudocercospora fuligena]
MRPGKGCESCRERHLKCVTEAGSKTCTRCLEADRECLFGPKFRFKQVAYVDAGSNGGRKQELTYEKNQVWVNTRKHFSFILEDGSGLEYGIPEDYSVQAKPANEPPQTNPSVVVDLSRRSAPINGMLAGEQSPQALTDSLWRPQRLPSVSESICKPFTSVDTPRSADAPGSSTGTPHPQIAITAPPDFASPASIDELTRRHEDNAYPVSTPSSVPFPVGSTDGKSPASLPTPGSIPKPNLSRREAYLVQHFINKIGPWMDVCDLSCHMTHELPRRAMQKPMVLYSLLAVSSRHLAIATNQPEPAEASFYHGQCLKLVIEQLSGPESSYDDSLLATTVCLRIYEEIEHVSDEYLHLHGTSRLLRAIPSFAYSGGLGEAACWQSLRQDIYVSVTKGVPPNFLLEDFEQSSAFTFRDDGACANIIILLFAKILRLTHGDKDKATLVAWNRLALDIEAWNDRRLRLFQPIYYEDMDITQGRPFPVVHMISPPQVAALQYYHACKAYMLLYKPTGDSVSGFCAAKRIRALEREVSYQLAAIIGLAESNPFVENANFTAHHLLRVAGYCITNPVQRISILDFLERIEKIMGWSTRKTFDLLKSQWQDLDDPED